MTPRLKKINDKEILPKLMTKLNYKNKFQAPRITNIVLKLVLDTDAQNKKHTQTKQCSRAILNKHTFPKTY